MFDNMNRGYGAYRRCLHPAEIIESVSLGNDEASLAAMRCRDLVQINTTRHEPVVIKEL